MVAEIAVPIAVDVLPDAGFQCFGFFHLAHCLFPFLFAAAA
jgi:hypothetical protein